MAVAFSNLTSGNGTTNPHDSASISPTSGGMLWLAAVMTNSSTSSGVEATLSLTGVATTWTEVASIIYSDRRTLKLFKGIGPFTNEAVTLTWSHINGYQSDAWIIDQVTGFDTGAPHDSAVEFYQSSASASSIDAPDVGSPTSGDVIYAAFGVEDSDAAPSLTSPLVSLGSQTGLGNVRHLLTGWDQGALTDETPSCAVTSSRGAVIAVIVNGAAGATGNPWYYYTQQ